MNTQMKSINPTPHSVIEQVLVNGNLSSLTEEQRVQYYNKTCESLGLNPLTQPFNYISLNGKLTLYAKKDATEQLRKLHGVSITRLEKEFNNGIYICTAYASDKDGRHDVATGAVNILNLKGEMLANALMKAESKAKRRVTLSLCGLGMLDETEIETIPMESKQETPVKKPVLKIEVNEFNSTQCYKDFSECYSLGELKEKFTYYYNKFSSNKEVFETINRLKEEAKKRIIDSENDKEPENYDCAV